MFTSRRRGSRRSGWTWNLFDLGAEASERSGFPYLTLPILAQSAVMAIEDGFTLARCCERLPDDVATAFDRYERARSERTRATVLGSTANVRRFHNPALAGPVGAKGHIDREWSRASITSRHEWLFTYDVLSAEI